jgi:hypothetical protein
VPGQPDDARHRSQTPAGRRGRCSVAKRVAFKAAQAGRRDENHAVTGPLRAGQRVALRFAEQLQPLRPMAESRADRPRRNSQLRCGLLRGFLWTLLGAGQNPDAFNINDILKLSRGFYWATLQVLKSKLFLVA